MAPHMKTIIVLLSIVLALGACGTSTGPSNRPAPPSPVTQAASGTLTLTIENIDVPGAAGTVANAINDSGSIVGVYADAQNTVRSFLFHGGKFTSLQPPHSKATYAQAINDGGDIAGDYMDESGLSVGFKWHQGEFSFIRCSGQQNTYVTGMNASGLIVGDCIDKNNLIASFKYIDGSLKPLLSTQEIQQTSKRLGLKNPDVGAADVNDLGVILGFFGWFETDSSKCRGNCGGGQSGGGGAGGKWIFWKKLNGQIDPVPQPIEARIAIPMALANNNIIVAQYFLPDKSKKQGYDLDFPNGYLIQTGKLLLLKIAGAKLVGPTGIDSAGKVLVGYYDSQDGKRHGFRAILS